MLKSIDRRQFHSQTLGSLLTFSLLETLFEGDAWNAAVQPIAAKWLADLNSFCQDVKHRKLTQVEWQQQVEQLMAQVELPELLKLVDFEKLESQIKFKEKGERSVRQKFPEVEGLPAQLVFGHQIFGLKQGRSVAPHGHNNMATAFLMLKGQCHGRHYDRVEDGEDFMIIRPTIDDQFSVGEFSTVSDFKDNIHWFKATSETAFIFNIHVLNVNSDIKRGGRVYVDPFGEELAHGLIKAPRINYKQAYERFG